METNRGIIVGIIDKQVLLLCITTAPMTPVIHHAQDGFIIWNVTDMTSESTYEIRYKQTGSQNFEIVSSNRTLLAYALHNLETDSRYTLEASQLLM